MQEGAVEGSPHSLVASEGERNVGDAPADLAAGADVLDDLAGPDEVHGIIIVLSHARAHSQDVGIEDHILWVEPNFLHQDSVRPLTDPHLQLTHRSQAIAREI